MRIEPGRTAFAGLSSADQVSGLPKPRASWLLTTTMTKDNILLIERPEQHVLLLTMNRPSVLNAMSPELEDALTKALDDFDNDDDLWVAIIAGKGRLFCAGADLTAWQKRNSSSPASESNALLMSPHGFGALSRRTKSSKPIIAAVHGGAYGGGCEIVLNCDLVVAEDNSKFALPEALRGVVAAAGGIVRIANLTGHQLASEMLFTGRTVQAKEAFERFPLRQRFSTSWRRPSCRSGARASCMRCISRRGSLEQTRARHGALCSRDGVFV